MLKPYRGAIIHELEASDRPTLNRLALQLLRDFPLDDPVSRCRREQRPWSRINGALEPLARSGLGCRLVMLIDSE